MNRHLLQIVLLISLSWEVSAQTNFYDITGKPVEMSDSVPALVICFSSRECHGCMIQLADFSKRWKQDFPNGEVYVMIRGCHISTMRMETSAVKDYFSKEAMPKVVYDLNPDNAQRFENIYGMKRFIALMLFDEKHNCEYVSYEQMFGNSRACPSYSN